MSGGWGICTGSSTPWLTGCGQTGREVHSSSQILSCHKDTAQGTPLSCLSLRLYGFNIRAGVDQQLCRRLTRPGSEDWTHFRLDGDTESQEKGLIVKMAHLPWF